MKDENCLLPLLLSCLIMEIAPPNTCVRLWTMANLFLSYLLSLDIIWTPLVSLPGIPSLAPILFPWNKVFAGSHQLHTHQQFKFGGGHGPSTKVWKPHLKLVKKKNIYLFLYEGRLSLYERSCSRNFPNKGWVVVSNLNVTCSQTRWRWLVEVALVTSQTKVG